MKRTAQKGHQSTGTSKTIAKAEKILWEKSWFRKSFIHYSDGSEGAKKARSAITHTKANRFLLLKNFVKKNPLLYEAAKISLNIVSQIRVRLLRRVTLVKLEDYKALSNITGHELFNACNYQSVPASIFPPNNEPYLQNLKEYFTAPKIYVVQLRKFYALGQSSFITNGEIAISHDKFDILTDLTSEEIHQKLMFFPKKKEIAFTSRLQKAATIPKAVNFLDACSSNYAHWLTEVLPRIIALMEKSAFSDFTLLIDEKLHPNILESLFTVVGHKHKIVFVAAGRFIFAERLMVVSVAGYAPFGLRNSSNTDAYFLNQTFNQLALKKLRQVCLQNTKIKAKRVFPKLVYLYRGKKNRSVENEEEIKSTLLLYGFTVIDINSLSFPEQVALFNTAHKIITPTGAVLANMLFASRNTHCYVLFPKSKIANYNYWLNLAAVNNVQLTYILGTLKDEHLEYQSDYYVRVNDLLNALGLGYT